MTVPVQLPEMAYVTDHKQEINGYQARLSLIRITVALQQYSDAPTDGLQFRVYRLVSNLCYIQDLAYAKESRRTTKNILALLNLTFVFYLDCKKVGYISKSMHTYATNSHETYFEYRLCMVLALEHSCSFLIF